MKVQDIELAQAIVEHVDTHLHERMTLDGPFKLFYVNI